MKGGEWLSRCDGAVKDSRVSFVAFLGTQQSELMDTHTPPPPAPTSHLCTWSFSLTLLWFCFSSPFSPDSQLGFGLFWVLRFGVASSALFPLPFPNSVHMYESLTASYFWSHREQKSSGPSWAEERALESLGNILLFQGLRKASVRYQKKGGQDSREYLKPVLTEQCIGTGRFLVFY